ncbi:protein translocase subunit SecA-like [Poecilia reticulata]|uniref:protein translocase subunit SecA-like n=1 Tax=Poecilia reticulata TaxID=8081 RepID=UPI0004A4609F|nr:PREDICTED: protein translocase subunit SecA-like [Poecilia reticulata]XP_017165792.1 PREDICTED: protein translocase subunit SecA-like [Poecilia reticulata]
MDPRVIHRVVTSFLAPRLFSPNENEKNLIKLLQGLVRSIKWRPEDVGELFDALLQRFESVCRNDRSQLLTWLLQMLHWIQINYITSTWRSNSGSSLLELIRDTAVTNEALKACLADDEDKTLDEIIEEIRDGDFNQVNNELLAEVRDIVSSVQAALRSRSSGSELTGLRKVLLILCQAAEKAHFRPRLTQMVSWCLMAPFKTGRLIQVGTGEGKSCIVAMFAAFRALRGEKVDIMSSSSVLAERDMREWKKFYELLKISVDCNINKQDEDSKKCYESQIVYGTAEQFTRDWLKHHVDRKDIFGQRTFQCAIVDEVDSLMLDEGHHVLYMSSDMPALQHLNPLLALIWATANHYSKLGSGHIVGRKYPFHQVVLEQIKQEALDELTVLQMAEDTGVLANGTVMEIQRNPSLLDEKTANVPADKLVEFFTSVETRFPSCQFALHSINTDGSIEELNRRPPGESGQRRVSLLLNGGFCQYMYPDTDSVLRATEEEVRRFLHFTPRELNRSEGSCYIPGFLSDLIDSKLKVWIKNAFRAQSMEKDHEYIFEGDIIVPVDYSCTDVVGNSLKWCDGLQQFLEMKHQTKLSDMTTITNYMSNVGLLQKYKSQIYGVSGTLGEQAEIESMRKTFQGIKTCQIPSFKRQKLFEVQGVIMKDERRWIEKICEVVFDQIKPTPYRSPRAVLVTCESIKLAKLLYQIFSGRVSSTMLYIKNNKDNSVVFTKKLGAGDVIIATNLAARGTDLQVSDSVKSAGGLFVVQTFLPDNSRVEAQGIGHTARQGSPGSAQMVVCFTHLSEPLQLLILTRNFLSFMENIADASETFLKLFLMHLRQYQRSSTRGESQELSSLLYRILTENTNSDLMMVKEIRDALVAEQLSSYVESDLPNIKKKEELFSQYLETLDLLYKNNNNKPAESDVSALSEFWGMWLLTKFSEEGSAVRLKAILSADLSTALQKLGQRESPSSNVRYYTIKGSELEKMGRQTESIDMYTKVINQDPCWAAVAFYNRASASLAQHNRSQDPECLNQALEDLQKALMSVMLHCDQLDVTYRYVTQQTTNPAGNSTTRFDKHIMARHTVLVSFKTNIYEAMQKVDRAKDTSGSVRVKKTPVYSLVSLEHLFPMPVILLESARAIYSRNPLLRHQLANHPSLDIFNEVMSVESMGLTHIYFVEIPSSLAAFFSKIARAFH